MPPRPTIYSDLASERDGKIWPNRSGRIKGNKEKEGERRELASERLHNSGDSQRYGRKVEKLLSRARVGMEDNACVSKVFETFNPFRPKG